MKKNHETQANVVVSAFQAVGWCVAGFFLGLTTLVFVFGFVYKLTFATALFWNRLAPETFSVVPPSFWGTFGVVVAAALVGGLTWAARRYAGNRRRQLQEGLKNAA